MKDSSTAKKTVVPRARSRPTREPRTKAPTRVTDAVSEDSGVIPIAKATHPDTRLGFLMHDVSRLQRHALDNLMKEKDITRAQWWVIAHLSRHDGMMQVHLADILDIGKASLGNLVQRLEQGGWVERRNDPIDGRVKRVYLTRKGRSLVEHFHGLELYFNERTLAGVSREFRDNVRDCLVLVKANLMKMIADAGSQNEPKPGLDNRADQNGRGV
jgi:DNA-binding MarR family transcriptional regulator